MKWVSWENPKRNGGYLTTCGYLQDRLENFDYTAEYGWNSTFLTDGISGEYAFNNDDYIKAWFDVANDDPAWIKDRNPEEDGKYLVLCQPDDRWDNSVMGFTKEFGWNTSKESKKHSIGFEFNSYLIAWMPLPEIYKEETK
ncbi:MAG: hypothetical protein IKG03_00480 [Clostridiales bacterium]|nr:hypothetical protein [Clostridiales bacterium]